MKSINQKEVKITSEQKNKLKRILNRRIKTSCQQLEIICKATETALNDPSMIPPDHNNCHTGTEAADELLKFAKRIERAKYDFNNKLKEFDSLIDSYYIQNTGWQTNHDTSYGVRSPIEDILFQLSQAVKDTIENHIMTTKKKPNQKTRKYRHLIKELVSACNEAQVGFKIKSKTDSPFYRLVSWAIHDVCNDKELKSLEGQISSVLNKTEEPLLKEPTEMTVEDKFKTLYDFTEFDDFIEKANRDKEK